MRKIKNTAKLIQIVMLFITSITLQSCAQSTAKANAEKIKDLAINTVNKTDEQWKKELTAEQYYVLREKGTERPFTGELLLNKQKGVYKCAACGNELFTDEMKFDSHCGWPSFDREIEGGKITTIEDNSLGMKRIEINCAKCGGHLGHIFDDGSTETGKRYCVNSVSLSFEPASTIKKEVSKPTSDTITLGGGCFWCIEAVYEKLDGVKSVVSGYAGGTTVNPTYYETSSGETGHAEVTQIVFDPNKTSVEEILKVFFTVHDPTTLNRQGADSGTQYRSIILYRNNEQKKIANEIIAALNKAKVYDKPIVTQVKPLVAFYKAENNHQDYYSNNKSQPYCQMVIQPKIEKFERIFKERIKK